MAPSPPDPEHPPDPGPGEQPRSGLGEYVRGVVLGTVLGRMMMPLAAGYLVIGAMLLALAWNYGPQRLVDAKSAAPYTIRKEGRIVESWVALELHREEMGESRNWTAFARATPCVVVETEGEWGGTRAFCGNPHWLHERRFAIHDLREMAPGVPFDFKRDESGFAMPEIRIEKKALDYLASNPSQSVFYKGSALDELRKRFDRPVELALVSWSQPPPRSFPLQLDPERPSEPMPAGYLDMRRTRAPEWFPAIVAPIFGLAFWLAGMNILLSGLVPVGRIVVGLLPLLALPWWGEYLPKAIAHLSVEAGTGIKNILGDIDTEARLVASEPAQALMHDGMRLGFGMQEGLYADTIGRFRFRVTHPVAKTPDAALAALTKAIADVTRGLGQEDRAELFVNLTRDRKAELTQAGLAFLPAAKEALMDPRSGEELRRAARRFLVSWTDTSLGPLRGQLAFDERVKLFRDLTDIPVDVIANPATWIVQHAEESEEPKPRRRR